MAKNKKIKQLQTSSSTAMALRCGRVEIPGYGYELLVGLVRNGILRCSKYFVYIILFARKCIYHEVSDRLY